ncbi:MAG: phage portal protein [Bacillota bacterium]
MNIADRISVLFTGRPLARKAASPGAMVGSLAGQPQYPGSGYLSGAQEAFGKNELVYACIMEIATSAPEAPLRVYQETDAGSEALPDHPLRLLMKNPNPITTEYELWELTLVHLYLSGNAFWEVVRDRAGRPVQIWPLRPDMVRIIPDKRPEIHHTYAYVVEGQSYPLGTDVVHFKFPNPIDPYFGQAPLRAALRAVATDNEATDFVKVLLQNHAIPGPVITTQTELDQATADRLTEKWRQKFGRNRRGDPAFLQAGMDVKTLGLSLRDLEFPDLRTISESRICSVFGVPPILVGANVGLQRSTFSNYEEARRSFWQETLMPLQRRLRDRINHKLLPMFGDASGLEARFDNTDVTALQEAEDKKWARADRAFRGGWATRNEARAEVGLDPVDGGDVFVQDLQRSMPPGDTGGNLGDPQPVSSEPGQKARPPHDHKAATKSAEERTRLADAYERKYRAWAIAEFQAEATDVMRMFAARKALDENTLQQLLAMLASASVAWDRRVRETIMGIMAAEIAATGQNAGNEVGVAFDLSNDEAVQFLQNYVMKFAQQISQTSHDLVRGIILAGQQENLTIREMRDRLATELEGWTRARAEMVARTETIRASNAGAKLAYKQAGIKRVRWLTADDGCPYCVPLNGREFGVDEPLFQQGDTWHPEGAPAPLHLDYEAVEHPPIHPNCRCSIIPVVE